jgi:hypothetical protein
MAFKDYTHSRICHLYFNLIYTLCVSCTKTATVNYCGNLSSNAQYSCLILPQFHFCIVIKTQLILPLIHSQLALVKFASTR